MGDRGKLMLKLAREKNEKLSKETSTESMEIVRDNITNATENCAATNASDSIITSEPIATIENNESNCKFA